MIAFLKHSGPLMEINNFNTCTLSISFTTKKPKTTISLALIKRGFFISTQHDRHVHVTRYFVIPGDKGWSSHFSVPRD
jgi:hypothetical protein